MATSTRWLSASHTIITGVVAATLLASCGSDHGLEPQTLAFTGSAAGCGNIFVFCPSDDHTAYLTVKADTGKLGLSTQAMTFDLAEQREGLHVKVDRYAGVPRSVIYCSDLLPLTPDTPVQWKAVSGKVTIQLIMETVVQQQETYRVTVQIQDAVFNGPDGGLISVPSATMADVGVGWLPG